MGLKYLESNAADMPLVGGQATRLQKNASNALDRVVTERLYDRGDLTRKGVPPDVSLPDPRVAKYGPETLGDNYKTRLAQSDLVSSPALQDRLTNAQTRYESLVNAPDRTPYVEQTRNSITDRLVAQKGRMTGEQYQSTRSQIGDRLRGSTNSEEVAALKEYKKALDDTYKAGLSPADAAALDLNNKRYAMMKQIQPAVTTAGENLSPEKLAQSVRAGRGAQYAARSGGLDELAAAAGVAMKMPPNSGTAARTGAQQLMSVAPNLAVGGTGGALATLLGGPVAGMVTAAAPFAIPYAATSKLGQAYLGNQALPQNARDIVAQVMAQQAASQPSGVERNKRERIRVPVYKE
jgi:hypothetical protein